MNKVILIGRLARDPEMRTTGSGISMTRFTVAVNRPFNPQNSNGQQQADFISCIAWRRQAENIAKFCSKGSQVAVEGRVQVSSFDGQDGQRRYTTDIVADNVTFLGTRSNGDNGSYGASNYSAPSFNSPEPNFSQSMPTYNEPQDMPSTDVSEDPFKDFGEEIALSDDDLPF